MDSVIFSRAKQRLEKEQYRHNAGTRASRKATFELYPPLLELDNQIRSCMFKNLVNETVSAEEAAELADLRFSIMEFVAENHIDLPEEAPLCKRCNDTMFKSGQPCTCLRKAYAAEQKKELAKTIKIFDQTFDSFDLELFSRNTMLHGLSAYENMSGMYDFCADYAQSFCAKSPNLLFTGYTGTGKTFLSTCIAGAVCEKGIWVEAESAVRLFAALEAEQFGRDEPSGRLNSSRGSKRFFSSSLLLLDDLGTEFLTPFVQTALYDLINTRLQNGVKTIINTNLTADDLQKRYLPQTVSRLTGEYDMLTFFGDDLRQVKKS